MLCLGVLLSLFVIPHASSLASLCALNPRPLEIAFLILGIGLLDFCGQVCFTPLEALLSDLFQEPDNCRQAFSMYAFMISLGGCIGYLLPAIDWAFLAPYLGGQESCLFSLLALIFLGCVLATLFVTEEAAQGDVADGPALKDTSPKPSLSWWCCCRRLARGPCLPQARHALQALRNLCALLPRLHGLYCRIPRVIRRLFVAELCSWMALMTFMLFYTDFVGEGLYHGVPRAKPGTEARRHYDEGEKGGRVFLRTEGFSASSAPLVMQKKKKSYSKLGFLQKERFPMAPRAWHRGPGWETARGSSQHGSGRAALARGWVAEWQSGLAGCTRSRMGLALSAGSAACCQLLALGTRGEGAPRALESGDWEARPCSVAVRWDLLLLPCALLGDSHLPAVSGSPPAALPALSPLSSASVLVASL